MEWDFLRMAGTAVQALRFAACRTNYGGALRPKRFAVA
jgi:hypothetical protein